MLLAQTHNCCLSASTFSSALVALDTLHQAKRLGAPSAYAELPCLLTLVSCTQIADVSHHSCGSLTCPHAGLHESGVLLQHDVEVVPQVGGQEVWTGVKELEIERGMPLAGGQGCCPQPCSQT